METSVELLSVEHGTCEVKDGHDLTLLLPPATWCLRLDTTAAPNHGAVPALPVFVFVNHVVQVEPKYAAALPELKPKNEVHTTRDFCVLFVLIIFLQNVIKFR